MKTSRMYAHFFAVAAWAVILAAAISVSAQETPSAKASRLMNESGLQYTKASDSVWTLQFEGKALKDITVIAAVGDDVMTVFVIVAKKKNINVKPELMRKLLGFNDQMDKVKIGIDKDDSVFVRTDLSLRILDKQELRENLDQVAAAANDVFAALKPYWVAGT